MEHKPKLYDYIITGAGAAGLSLLTYILNQDSLKSKRILIIDRESKDQNDRTWCFWDKAESPFDSILKHTWDKLYFQSPKVSKLLEITPYQYKMLDSLSFYKHTLALIAAHPNVEMINDTVKRIDAVSGIVYTAKRAFQATYIFNSILFNNQKTPGKHDLIQHFKGVFIRTNKLAFNPAQATLMDFSVAQYEDCRFMYVLPISHTEALIEYTGFSKNTLSQEEYDFEISAYIQSKLKIQDFEVTHEEYGEIPMTDAQFNKGNDCLINIGTAGGATKASTGYTFSFIQKQCRQIAEKLNRGQYPIEKKKKLFDKYKFYDSIFLRVLSEKRIPAASVFHDLFSKLPAPLIFAFLDEESTLIQDIRLMYALDKGVFMSAAIRNYQPIP